MLFHILIMWPSSSSSWQRMLCGRPMFDAISICMRFLHTAIFFNSLSLSLWLLPQFYLFGSFSAAAEAATATTTTTTIPMTIKKGIRCVKYCGVFMCSLTHRINVFRARREFWPSPHIHTIRTLCPKKENGDFFLTFYIVVGFRCVFL